jgi:hypothetical protein
LFRIFLINRSTIWIGRYREKAVYSIPIFGFAQFPWRVIGASFSPENAPRVRIHLRHMWILEVKAREIPICSKIGLIKVMKASYSIG